MYITRYEQLTRSFSQRIAAKGKELLERESRRQAKQSKAAAKALERQQYHDYRDQVRLLTEWQDLHQVPGYERRGQGWHLDHVVSIRAAFLAGWPVEKCAHFTNLQMLPAMENLRKGNGSYSSLDARQLTSCTDQDGTWLVQGSAGRFAPTTTIRI